MNIREIFILNRALDGKDITFMPSFQDIGITGIMIDAIKDGMINRGLLRNYREFTEEGLRITDRLRRYKEAKKHVKLDNLLIGIVDENESIAILWNPELEEYAITVAESALGADQIAEGYEFITGDTIEPDGDAENLTYDEFAKRYETNSANSFRLTSQGGKEVTDEIYCRDGEKLFVYDCKAETLFPQSKPEVLARITERINLP